MSAMQNTLRRLALAAALVMLASTGHALPLMDGSLSLAGVAVTQNGANLAVSTLVTAADTIVVGPGVGDYAPVALFSSFGPHALDLSNLVALAAAFSLSNPTYGSYAASSAVIVQQLPDFLDIYIVGTFTPAIGGPLDVFDPTPTALRISVNQSGKSEAEAVTLNSVPEPVALTLLGIGLTGAAMARRRA